MKNEKQITVAAVLNSNLERIYKPINKPIINQNDMLSCVDVIEEVLKNEPKVIKVDADRCIKVLKDSALKNKINLFLSTLVTWTSCIKVS